MDEKWQVLYNGLCQDTELIRLSCPNGQEQAESCFKSCLRYWEKVKQLVRAESFAGDVEEIEFFKTIKPKFTGQLEFYSLVYQFHLFRPPFGGPEIAEFRENERRRIERFRLVQHSIIHYFLSGQTDRDADYFLRRNRPTEPLDYARPWDMDAKLLTVGDWVLTVWFGMGLYEEYLKSIV